MSHKAGKDFFRIKRDWSRRKDLVLEQYLTPYLAKIATQGRPVLIVDGFAGPGRFGDGEAGSPVIICDAVAKSSNQRVEVWCVERDIELEQRLRQAITPYNRFAKSVQESLFEILPDIEKEIASKNVFLYLDPFTVTGLLWESLDRIFAQVNRTRSVEVLINFNVFALGRAACVAIGKSFDVSDETSEMIGESDSTKQTISDVLGGNWWIESFKSSTTFPQACEGLVSGYVQLLKRRFTEVCWHDIKEKHDQAVPNYVLAFGSRHPDAFELMNDAMAKSLKQQAAKEAPTQPTIFELRAESLVPELSHIRGLVREALRSPTRRGEIIISVMRLRFGFYTRAEIRGEIEQMLRGGILKSSSGKSRVNDDTVLFIAS